MQIGRDAECSNADYRIAEDAEMRIAEMQITEIQSVQIQNANIQNIGIQSAEYADV